MLRCKWFCEVEVPIHYFSSLANVNVDTEFIMYRIGCWQHGYRGAPV